MTPLGPFLDTHQEHGDLSVVTREDGVEVACLPCQVVWTKEAVNPERLHVSRMTTGMVLEF